MRSRIQQLLLLSCLLVTFSSSEKERTKLFSEEIIYRTVGDNRQNYYVSVIPNGPVQGLIVLLPGFGMPPEKFLTEINLESFAVQNGLMMLVPSPQGWGTHYVDDASIDTLHLMIQEASRKYGLVGKKFVIGGFSIGGTGALRYAERSIERGLENLTLVGAFAVDSPLDFERLWFSFEKELQNGPSQEAEYFVIAMKNSLGGSPKQHYSNYVNRSPFLASEKHGGRAQLLKDFPVRFYVEPDTAWWKANGWLEYQHQNAYDIDNIVRQLRELGNKRVQLIKTENKGYRKNGRRHPHSWSIVDEKELMDWILSTMVRL